VRDDAPTIRAASVDDAAACLAIYAPIVRETSISFELEPPSVEEFAGRIAQARERHEWLVAERDGAVTGYAYANTFRARAAYRFACESSVYVADSERGRRTGERLMRHLVERLRALGFAQVIAGATLPNPASAALHERLGFRHVGRFEGVGHKFGAWHAVGFWQLDLTAKSEVDAKA
jgi:L-amino acid N-acyltransferase YncA